MSKKKYKLKGAKPAKRFSFGETPEGVPFIDIIDKRNRRRFLNNGCIEFYANDKLVWKYDPIKTTEITVKPLQIGDFQITDNSFIFKPKKARRF